jgi:transglutaminase-like putative cysteine protease
VPLAIPTTAVASWTQVVPWLVAAGALGLAHVQVGVPGPVVVPVSGIVLLAVAIAAGTAAPWVLPGYQSEAWAALGTADTPRGYQPIVDVSTRLRAPEERDVLQVRSSRPTYLRLAGLDSFDGATWRLGPPDTRTFRPDPAQLFPADRPLPPEEPAQRTRTVEADIEVLGLENLYVPLPYQPREVLGPIRDELVWSTEGGFLAAYDPGDLLRDPQVGLTAGAAYRVLAEQPDPTIEDLRAVTVPPDVLARATRLPRAYPELGALAREIYDTAGATTAVDRALALQDWFIGPAGGFTYDLDVPALRGEDALTRFVLEDRVGYCEYFATAMAVMLRETGIPARVAVGFLPGERIVDAGVGSGEQLDTYLVTTADAHAWVEVLFPGHGWITFEPTPRDDGAQLLPRAQDLLPDLSEAEREAAAPPPAPEVEEVPPDSEVPDPGLPEATEGPEAADEAPGTGRPGGLDSRAALAALGVLTLLAAVVLWPPLRRRRQATTLHDDPHAAVLQAQRALFRTAAWLGTPRRPHETTPEVLRRWEDERHVPPGTTAVADAVQAAAFGGGLDPDAAATTVATLDQARTQLSNSISTGEALRARTRWIGRIPTIWRDRVRTWWHAR